MSVRQLRRSMSSQELSRWLAYDKLDQVPDPVLIGARIASVIATAMSSKDSNFTPDDFTYRMRPRPRVVSGEAGRAFFQGVSKQQEIKVGTPIAKAK